MAQRVPLPDELTGRAFSVAGALSSGVTPGRLRSGDLAAPFSGIRLPAAMAHDFSARCAAMATAFGPEHAFAGPTAALLWGLPLPRRFEQEGDLHVSTAPGLRAMRRNGVAGSERSPLTVTTSRAGVPLSDPASCWLELGRHLSVDDLVAAGDFLVTGDRGRNPLSSIAELESALARSRGQRGLRCLTGSIREIRAGAWSRPESLLRLLLTRSGIPEPQLNVTMVVAGKTYVVDLWWAQFSVAVEYDGMHHAQQWSADVVRTEILADAMITVVHVVSTDLFQRPDQTVRRVADRLTSRGWMPSSPIEPSRSARFLP